jgi:hypothetical protein
MYEIGSIFGALLYVCCTNPITFRRAKRTHRTESMPSIANPILVNRNVLVGPDNAVV